MAGDKTTELQQTATEGAIAADQQQVEPQPVLAGPTTAREFNTIGERLIPKGCFRFEDVRFEFDSSFVRPELKDDLSGLADLIDRHTITLPGDPGEKIPPPLSIFGHADPVGNDDYNKQLSGRRALAIYGMLVRDENFWENLFTQPFGGDKWGNKQIQTMLEAVGHSPGAIDGAMGPDTTEAVKAFQREQGLPADGVVGSQTRKALYRAYMDFLCGPRLALDKEKNFLARHKDGDGLKGDVQGCGEFNPVLLFSQEENARFEQASDKTERNQENARNRRVMALLFAAGRRVKPDRWPCPRVQEGVAACKKRFFPDAEKRRSFQDERREFDRTRDTFACRFYQIISDDSPCERLGKMSEDCFIFLKLFDDSFKVVLANTKYELRGQLNGKVISAKTDGEGIARHELIPDDHYELDCDGKRETVEVFYMIDKEAQEGKPWFMRVRGFEVSGARGQEEQS